MKIRILILALGATLAGAVVSWFVKTDELGLTASERHFGNASTATLLTNGRKAAELFLADRRSSISSMIGEEYKMTIDHEQASRIQSLGYRSSFYYHHWIIYLPFKVDTKSGKNLTAVVCLRDALPGHRHDPRHFQVHKFFVIKEDGTILGTIGD